MTDEVNMADFSTAYFATSIEFQRVTPFENFKQFVSQNPMLTSYEMLFFEKVENMSERRGMAQVSLQSAEGVVDVNFELSFQVGSWKIIGMEIGKFREGDFSETFAKVTKLIEDQLIAIRRGNATKAYSEFLSKKYQKEFPLEAYEHYIVENDYLKHVANPKFYKASFKLTQGSLEGSFNTDDGESLQAKYQLVNEEGEWKLSQPQKMVSYL